jgi:hypothetical protein
MFRQSIFGLASPTCEDVGMWNLFDIQTDQKLANTGSVDSQNHDKNVKI